MAAGGSGVGWTFANVGREAGIQQRQPQGTKQEVCGGEARRGKGGHRGQAGLIYATRRPTSWDPRVR